MSVALTVHDFDPGYGQGRYAVELVQRLAARFDFHVLANRFAVPPGGGVTHQKISAWRRTALTTIPSYLCNVERRLYSRPHKLVHAQGLSSWTADLITAHVCNAARTAAETNGTMKSRLFHQLIDPLEEAFYRRTKARHVIAVSQGVARDIQSFYGWSGPMSVIYHGIDTERFQPASTGEERARLRQRFDIKASTWLWLFVGEADKGLETVIMMLPSFPGAVLAVVSRSDPAPYRSKADHLGVASRIRWLGPVSDVATLYPLADVFVYPSSYDAFGMVVAEAMACGIPVIAGRSIGAAEWIDDGNNGLLCDPANPVTLHTALNRLAADATLCRKLAAAGRATALEHTWDRCANETARVYDQLLAKGRIA
ncbi:MAG TPA: glycosyltransferase family 4 protein [Roseimicrobium sp.]|nr:glycosyltransferase family 4 protein [Roseimicrobium sp.]